MLHLCFDEPVIAEIDKIDKKSNQVQSPPQTPKNAYFSLKHTHNIYHRKRNSEQNLIDREEK